MSTYRNYLDQVSNYDYSFLATDDNCITMQDILLMIEDDRPGTTGTDDRFGLVTVGDREMRLFLAWTAHTVKEYTEIQISSNGNIYRINYPVERYRHCIADILYWIDHGKLPKPEDR